MSHITLRTALMLLFVTHSVQAEKLAERAERIDPFHPLATVRCLPSATLPPWQLKGVIGSGERWIGWLAQPEAVGWIRLASGETIPPGNWLVSQLDKSGAKLVPMVGEAGCDGLPDEMLLASPFINKRAE
ncbi:DNA utilization family protein [Pectobacterium peruviense]|uniref:HofP n=1 Tax=Pectobacterium peruviense TaxID=2066479 RepID=A0ABX4S8L3_9GAMM|nr:DNA utilization family protein [Pectobacterium peruviense]KML64781.1 hofP [Pectobacterium peruviense]PKX82308.1 hofP [Pectobacterium peruviense]PKX86376.1 hofP [Pectobacterium peruviense]